MRRKHFWAWAIFVGFVVMILGSLIAFIPIIGIPLMLLGTAVILFSIPFLIVILIRERRADNEDMNEEISKEDLRP